MIWNYSVEETKQVKFKEAYGKGGYWFKFFEPCTEYMGTELIKNTTESSYMLIDKWTSKRDYEGFIKTHQLEYDSLNDNSKDLFDEETLIGAYESI